MKIPLLGAILKSVMDAAGFRIANIGTPIEDGDAVNKKYMEEHAGEPSDYEQVKADAEKGASHANKRGSGTATSTNPHGITADDIPFTDEKSVKQMVGEEHSYFQGKVDGVDERASAALQAISSLDSQKLGKMETAADASKLGGELPSAFARQTGLDNLAAVVEQIKMSAYANVTVVGAPTFVSGSVSGFSAGNYLVFPTTVDIDDRTVEFNLSFSTGPNVTTQENILDSSCGLAFAVRGGKFVFAVSINGTSFTDEVTAEYNVMPNTSYRTRLTFTKVGDSAYKMVLSVADGQGDYTEVGSVTEAAPIAARPLYIGGANPVSGIHHIFHGTLNLNMCSLVLEGKTVWSGYYTALPDHAATHAPDGTDPLVGYAKSSDLDAKQDTIADLETIRSGAAKGASAVRSVNGVTGEVVLTSDTIQRIDLFTGEPLDETIEEALEKVAYRQDRIMPDDDGVLYINRNGVYEVIAGIVEGIWFSGDITDCIIKTENMPEWFAADLGLWADDLPDDFDSMDGGVIAVTALGDGKLYMRAIKLNDPIG